MTGAQGKSMQCLVYACIISQTSRVRMEAHTCFYVRSSALLAARCEKGGALIRSEEDAGLRHFPP